ncbi:MAG: hypothetical protein HeimC3_07360 [Candidatus Heimdallarchaeota archaeon LC_3]|nr:MAG: hypothetical protein HeimC3_07360 [Candidatus Heimdallarchaeota archaeon LC_3]
MKYDKVEISVSKNTCVQVKFINLQTIVHDFSIDQDDGNSFEEVYNYMANNTAGYKGTNFKTFNVSTQDLNVTISSVMFLVIEKAEWKENSLLVKDLQMLQHLVLKYLSCLEV